MAAARSASPTKRRRQMDSADKDDYVDLEMTSHDSLQPSKAVVSPPMSIRSGSPSKPIKSGASERSKSPTKRMGQMSLRPRPTVLKYFYDHMMALPEGLPEMLSTVVRYGRGYGVIAESRKASISSLSVDDPSFKGIGESAFDHEEMRDSLGPSPTPDAVAKIVKLASKAEMDGHSEAHWNCRVHNAVLDLAIHNEHYQDRVDWMNCTTAEIQPKSLISLDHTGKPGEAKTIDLAICIEPDTVAIEAMRAMAARHPDMTASVNHSWHTPLLTRPIGINIETKRTGDGWDTAVVQLGIWVAAQFVKLEQLIHDFDADPNQIPFLPIVVVQGHEWYFLAASRGDFGQTNIWSKRFIGSTSDTLGVYQIVVTIQYLARWADTVYRPWFYTNALGMQLPQTEAPAAASPGASGAAASITQ
ncbi:MAG: hypothetical protein M1815_005209 [Lichina confinis]|nr:MAG: hypothetical protein M1815_005209 [Lichina confinis]